MELLYGLESQADDLIVEQMRRTIADALRLAALGVSYERVGKTLGFAQSTLC